MKTNNKKINKNKKVEKFISAVNKNKNVDANELLEQILKEKVSKKLYDTLKA